MNVFRGMQASSIPELSLIPPEERWGISRIARIFIDKAETYQLSFSPYTY
jgi:hypothetical protein